MRSFDKSLFREQAILSQGKTERLDVLPQVTAPHEWAVLAGLALILLGVGAWSVFGSIERRLTTECLLVRPGERRAVLAELSGTVADVLVDTGDAVRSGQVIARVRRPELRRAMRIARTRIAALETRPAGGQLQAARAELADLEMIEAVGDVIVSPYAGEVTALALTPGQPVAAGAEVARIRAGTAAGMEALAFVAPAQAAQVAAGMAARVLAPTPRGRGVSVLEARRAGGFPASDGRVRLVGRTGVAGSRSRSSGSAVPARRARPGAGRRRVLPARHRHPPPGAHTLPGADRERLMPGRGQTGENPAVGARQTGEDSAARAAARADTGAPAVRCDRMRRRLSRHRAGAPRALGPPGGVARRVLRRPRREQRGATSFAPPNATDCACAAGAGSRTSCAGSGRPPSWFWEFNHFLVLEGCGADRFHLNDPANGRRSVSAEEFDRKFTGVVLVLEPGPDFQPGGARPGVIRQVWPWLRDVKAPLSFATACGLLMVVPGLALPLLLSLFVDLVLGGGEADWSFLPLAAAAAAGFLYLLAWLQQRCLRRLAVRLSVVQANRLLSHLFRLPIRYFAHRFAGDLAARVQLVDVVATVGSTQFAGIVIELVTSALFLAVLLAVDPLLAAAVAAVAAAGAVVMRAVSRRRTDEKRQMQREGAMMTGLGGAALRSMESLQATAAEDDFFSRWTGYQARELTARQRFSELGHANAAAPGLFMMLGGAAVMGLGGWRVMGGEMTLGTLMGLHVVAGNFLRPVGRFVQFADLLQTLDADLQRLGDVFDAAEDPALAGPPRTGGRSASAVETLGGRLRLAGRIELRNVTFGYQANRPPQIRNLSLTIEPGQQVAVVGPSGSGKSTLLMLVGGVCPPWSGEILFDGVPRNDIPREVLNSSVAIVDQHPFLFAATVRENLTMWNPTVPEQQLVQAARDAHVHDEITSRPGGYDGAVRDGGRNFSGGQRQRLEIGRALVPNPSMLLLDEATSALDAATEARIEDALRRRGCTCLVVAHRVNTIRNCNRIVVLDRGEAVQHGTHDELFADRDGLYHRLVRAG